MNAEEIPKLLDMLDTLCPDSRHPARDKKTLYGYFLALEPYSYEDVRAKALEHIRASKYYPRISELIPEAEPGDESKEQAKRYDMPTPETVSELREECAKIRERCHAAGIPSPLEAKQQGVSYAEWSRRAREANV